MANEASRPTNDYGKVPCPECRGRGWHVERQQAPSGGMMKGEFPCLDCDGTGEVDAP